MQELKLDQENDAHFLDVWPKSVNVGNFVFVFEVIVFIIVLGNSGEQFEITLVSSSDQSYLKFHFLLLRIDRS